MAQNLTGSDVLNAYHKKVVLLERFHEAFTNGLLSELKQRSPIYEVEATTGGFEVVYHDLVAAFEYHETNQTIRIKHGNTVSASEYFIDHNGIIWQDSVAGGRAEIEWVEVIHNFINPALEEKVREGLLAGA